MPLQILTISLMQPMNIVWGLPGEPIIYVNKISPFRDGRTWNPRERTRETVIDEVLHRSQLEEPRNSPARTNHTRDNTPIMEAKIAGRWLTDSIVVICWIFHIGRSLHIVRSTWYLY